MKHAIRLHDDPCRKYDWTEKSNGDIFIKFTVDGRYNEINLIFKNEETRQGVLELLRNGAAIQQQLLVNY